MRRAVAIVAVLTVVAGQAGAYPGDVFENAQPAQAPAVPTSASGDSPYGVSDQGAATYSIPIVVPPGRHGMAPSLALSYSSRAPVRGGLAAGWSMAMPRIEVDTTLGRLAETTYRTGAGTRLIRVDEPVPSDSQAFRADRDDTFTRYERVFGADGTTQSWRARTLDGRVRYFGETEMSRDVPHAASAPGAAEGRWFLTREVDRFGNEVRYYYQKAWSLIRDESTLVPVDIYPTSIEWGGATGRNSFARIDFDYAPLDLCPGSWVPIGSSFSWRTGFPLMEGARRLATMRIEVKDGSSWTERRRYTLGYDGGELRCSYGRTHAPLRLLTSVQERAIAPDGTAIDLPAQTFEYGRLELELTERSVITPIGTGTNAQAPQKAGGWPTLDAMLLDLDGDGKLDWLWSQPTAHPDECGVTWQRNRGDGTFDPTAAFTLPTNPWAGSARNDSTDRDVREGCSLSHQFSRAANGDLACGLPATYTSYRFMDLTGDGRPDLVTAIDANHGRYRPEDDVRLWPDGPITSCPGDEGACRDEDGEPMRCAVSSPVPPFMQMPVDDPPPSSTFCPEGSCQLESCAGDSFCECAPGFCDSWGEQEEGRSSDYAPPIDNSGGFSDIDGMFWNGPAFQTGDQGKEGRTPSHQRYECAQQPEEQCGRFIWRVHHNTGDGFAEDPQLVLSPVPLESDRATSALGAGALAASSSWHGFVDMDGDGIPDAVFMTPFWSSDGIESGDPPTSFQVFRGDGTGGFHGDAAGEPYLWSAPTLVTQQQTHKRARVSLSRSHRIPWIGSEDEQRASLVAVTLEDLNGDGLPDYVDARNLATGDDRVRVFYNTGDGFETARPGSSLEVPAWNSEVLTTLGESRQYVFDWRANGHLDRGWSRDVIRTVDIDADGLLDVVMLPQPQAGLRNPWSLATQQERARVFVNVGDRMVPMGETDKLMEWWAALARIRFSSGHPFEQPRWTLATDFLDLDGDGLPEAFNNDYHSSSCTPDDAGDDFIAPCAMGDRSWTSPRDGQGMRLLRRVRTGTGAEIGFEYEPVTEDRVPHPLWVASRMTVTPGPAANGGASPSLMSTFEFNEPRYLPDERGTWAFRGFAETVTTAPGGARTVKHFDHALDWTGPLVESRVEAAGGQVDHLTTTAWEERSLFGGAITSLHQVRTETRTCGASQSAAACATGGALRVETTTWSGLTAADIGGVELAYAIVATTTDDRLTTYEHRLQADPHTYRILPLREQRFETIDDEWSQIGRTDHEWDPSWRAEVATHAYVDAATAATTTRKVDLTTGNVLMERKPEQTAAGSNQWTTLSYDPDGVFVVATTNELFHTVTSTWDLATGAQLSQRGPNSKNGVLEGWVRTIDGLGRPLTERVHVDSGSTYVEVVIATTTYGDAPDPANGGFRRTTANRRIELAEDRWKTVTTDVDGLGRAAVTSEWVDAAAVATERRSYDAAGHVSRVDAPTPSGSSGTVAWLFGHDALGRPTSVDGPDGSGQRWTYDGRWSTRSDWTGSAGGTATVTRTLVDGFGQLVEVGEQHAPGEWKTTFYTHDGNGAMTSIVDPDTVTTRMDHDWHRQRVRIRRGDRSWSYLYNRNGKLIATIAPVPAGGEVAAYTTTIAYDALDREVSRLAGSRALTAEQLAQQGAASVQRTYDGNVGNNGVGRLAKVTQPWGNTTYFYDARGLTRERRTKVTLPGLVTDTRIEKLTYNALGTPRTIKYADGTGNHGSLVTFTTGDRGLPASTAWGSTGLGNYTYSAAGSVMTRSAHRFDHLTERDERGRVTRQRVRSNLHIGMTTRAEATYAYDGTGQVVSMTWGIAPKSTFTAESFAFTYDGRGQLSTATGAAGYSASFWYSHAGRVTRAQVAAPSAAMPVPARDVVYDYAIDDDWETPDALLAPDDSIWLGLVHDSSGNTTARTGTAGGSTLVHDGLDQLREVAGANGREAYWYDGDRQRVGVATYDAAGALVNLRWSFGAAEVTYLPSGTVEKTVAYVGNVGPVARIENRIRAELVFGDHYGHTLAVLDTNGVLLAGFVYGPFGEILRQAGTQIGEVNRRFNGKELDTSGLYYYGYRYYDPLSLTWTQADPLYRLVPDLAWAQPRRALAYTFSLNNPMRYVDPNGLDGSDDGATVNGFCDRNACDPDMDGKTDAPSAVDSAGAETTKDGVTVVTFTGDDADAMTDGMVIYAVDAKGNTTRGGVSRVEKQGDTAVARFRVAPRDRKFVENKASFLVSDVNLVHEDPFAGNGSFLMDMAGVGYRIVDVRRDKTGFTILAEGGRREGWAPTSAEFEFGRGKNTTTVQAAIIETNIDYTAYRVTAKYGDSVYRGISAAWLSNSLSGGAYQ